ncbi:DUF1758 domain-containing protein [Trichonephila clavipes]|nr:DUF1758 domain-containing protein [Trichonephila clavipes]
MNPSKRINISDLVIPERIVLADEGFNQPSEISCWNTLDKTLRSFWETENISEEQPIISDELSYCEKHFEKTHFRKPCGGYSVSLPFKENIQENVNLGDSRSIASKRLDPLWRRVDHDPKLNNLYTKFIEEYLSLDHMEEITNIDDKTSEKGFFLPHHGALRAGIRSQNLESIILYGFSDASEEGFGAVTCVSVIKNNGDRHGPLLCSKSRVAPPKTLNIPG